MYIHAEGKEKAVKALAFRRVNKGARLWLLARGFSVFALAESQSVEASSMTDWMSAAAPYWGWYVNRMWLPFVSQFDLRLFNDHVRPSR